MNETLFADSSNITALDTTAVDYEYLSVYICAYLDLPKTGIDCSLREPSRCFKCKFNVEFFADSEERINDFNSPGHLSCRILMLICTIIGIVGVISNVLIIVVNHTRKTGHSFDFLLTVLAHVDFWVCLTCMINAVSVTAFMDNWMNRDLVLMYFIYISSNSVVIARAFSTYITVLITGERYLAIAFPLQAKAWFTLGRTKGQVGIILGFVIITSIPRLLITYLGPNIYGNQQGGLDVPSLREFKYVFLVTQFQNDHTDGLMYYYQIINYLMEYSISNIGILIFNVLTYRKISHVAKQRRMSLSVTQKELQPARMFAPIAVVFLITNLCVFLFYPVLPVFFHRNYRETWLVLINIFALNSAVNFWIYCFRGASFRSAAASLLKYYPCQ